ncbi:hypothetical protein HDR67_03570 [bacterium]|nr:hypothetical protein [bacterium]
MFERIKDCICHPRYIGKYHKDNAGIVFLTILIFFVLCLSILGARSYTTRPFDESVGLGFTSNLIQAGPKNTKYTKEDHLLSGESFVVDGGGYRLIVLPEEGNLNLKLNTITIVLNSSDAVIYFSDYDVSKISYSSLQLADFDLGNVATNVPKDTYYFRIMIDGILDSSKIFFQTFSFLQEMISILVYYLICVLFCYVLSIAINPTINRGVRAKFSFYDGCVFLIGAFFAYLFNVEILLYLALALPLVYTGITFRHVVKVVIKR